MKRVIPILIAVVTGLIVLSGYFFQTFLGPVTGLLVNWAILLVGLAGLIGIGYLLKMHILRLVRREKGGIYSVIVLTAFIITTGAGFLLNTQHAFYRNWVLNIQIPVETSLLAILAVTLLYASLRIIQTRGWTLMSIGFLTGALVSLVLNLRSLQPAQSTTGAEWVDFVSRLPQVGLRGILIGIALGGLVVGLRVLLAIDRPFEDEK